MGQVVPREEGCLLLVGPVGELIVGEDGSALRVVLDEVVGLVPQIHSLIKFAPPPVALAVDGCVA